MRNITIIAALFIVLFDIAIVRQIIINPPSLTDIILITVPILSANIAFVYLKFILKK